MDPLLLNLQDAPCARLTILTREIIKLGTGYVNQHLMLQLFGWKVPSFLSEKQ